MPEVRNGEFCVVRKNHFAELNLKDLEIRLDDPESRRHSTPRPALGGASVPHPHVGWGMALHCLDTALPRRLVRTFVLSGS